MGDAVFVVRVAWCGGWGSELGIRGARCESAHNACHLLQHIAARVRIVHYSTHLLLLARRYLSLVANFYNQWSMRT
mgnify:CR=1 FL=1